jgi:succinyl-diaminopimelate desuccinylase
MLPTLDKVDGQSDVIDVVDLTRHLVQFDTINPPGNERACAQELQKLLADAGFETDLTDMGEGRANLTAYLGNGSGAPLGFTGHLDTVPLGAQSWKHDPFACTIENGRLYGRGTTDMKGGVAAFVVACLKHADILRNGPGVVLLITAGEETGSDGAIAMVAQGVSHIPGALVVAEPTLNRPLAGHKGALWLRVVTEGKTAHGSMPEKGVNAVVKAADVIQKIVDFDFKIPPHPDMGAPTLNIGTISGGLNLNSVPDRAEIGVDIRSVAGLKHENVRADLAHLLGDSARIEPIIDLPSVWTDTDNAWLGQVCDAVADVTSDRPRLGCVSYFTDASIFTPAFGNLPTVVLGPGDPAVAHMTDEYCEIKKLQESVIIYAELIRRWSIKGVSV